MTFADLAALAVRQLPATTRDSNRHDSSEREAQRLLRKGTFSVSAVAFEVGYESAAQFSRDYKRRFGVPPKRDLTK